MSIFGPKCGHCQNQYVFWKWRDFPRILLQLKQVSIVWLYFVSIGYCITSLILLHQTKTLRMCKRERECLIECVNECRIVNCGPQTINNYMKDNGPKIKQVTCYSMQFNFNRILQKKSRILIL